MKPKTLLIILLAAMTLSKITEKLSAIVKTTLEDRFYNMEDSSYLIDLYMHVIENSLDEYQFDINNYLGSGTYGTVLEASNPKYGQMTTAIKVMHTTIDKLCDDNTILKQFKDEENSPVIKLIDQFDFTSTINGGKMFKFCIMVLEKAEKDLVDPIFKEDETDKKKNSLILGHLIWDLIKDFAIFNFK